MNLKTVRLTRFQKPQLQSVAIFFKFVHLWLHLYSLCHLYLILTFWAVIFVSLNLVAVSAVWILIKQYNNNSYSEVMNIWKSYTRTAGLRVIWKKIIVVVDATFAVAKRKPEKKNSGLYGNRTLDLCDTGAALYQLQAGRWIGSFKPVKGWWRSYEYMKVIYVNCGVKNYMIK